jgi:hypothetical protein
VDRHRRATLVDNLFRGLTEWLVGRVTVLH